MEPFVILVVVGSAILHAVWNTIIKGGPDKLIETSMKACGSAVAAFLVLPFVPFPTGGVWTCLGLTMCLHCAYYLSISFAYRGADLGYAYTIMRGSAPLLTALVSMLAMREALSLNGWVGVIALSSGVLILALDNIRRGGFSLPATFIALCSAAVITGYTLVDGKGVRLSETALSYICWAFFLNAVPFTLSCLAVRGVPSWLAYVRRRWTYGLFGGLCSLVAYGLALWAMTRAPIAAVAALRETSVVFGMLFGVIFLKEKVTPARVTAVFLVLAGAVSMRL